MRLRYWLPNLLLAWWSALAPRDYPEADELELRARLARCERVRAVLDQQLSVERRRNMQQEWRDGQVCPADLPEHICYNDDVYGCARSSLHWCWALYWADRLGYARPEVPRPPDLLREEDAGHGAG